MIFIGLVVVGALLVAYGVYDRTKPAASTEALSTFATCLKEKGATFYGAFWCPHCQAQKQLFGNAAKDLPYVECSTEDGQAQTQVCIDAGIDGYPTWQFADGSRLSGEQTLEALGEKTQCAVPK